MRIHLPVFLTLLVSLAADATGAPTLAAPLIQAGGVVNAASYTKPGFPGGSLAQGSIFSIFGSRLGPANPPPEPSSYPLATSLGGVSIQITQGGTTVNAIPFYVSAVQVSAILPSNTPLGADTLVLTYNDASTAPFAITVVASSVGIFSINSGGFGPSVTQNYVSATSLPVNSRSVSAMPGQIVEMYGTGLGPALSADNQPPQAGSLPVPTEVWVGGQPVTALAYSGRSPCCAGLDQFVFTIPANVPLGCDVPVVVRTSGATPSNVVTMAISADGSPCSDAIAPIGNAVSGGKTGAVALTRASVPLGLGSVTGTVDSMFATFRSETGGDFAFNSLFSLPPAGSCTSMQQTGKVITTLPGLAPSGAALDAGVVSAANSQSNVTTGSPNYATLLGISTSVPGFLPTSFLDSGPFVVNGQGGNDVGKFTVNIPAAPAISWTNPASTVARSNALTVNWSFSGAGASDLSSRAVLVAGTNYDAATNEAVSFLCTATAAAGTFTVPAYILERLPPTSTASADASISLLMVASIPTQPPASFTATGLDHGTGMMVSASGQYVTYQ